MGHIGLDNVDVAGFQKPSDVPAGIKPLPVARGMDVTRATSLSASRFSGSTGSSIKSR
jgi:hypothetical protein